MLQLHTGTVLCQMLVLRHPLADSTRIESRREPSISCSLQIQLRERDGAFPEFFHRFSLHDSMDIYVNKRVKNLHLIVRT